jgi:hypothetical protein
MTFAGVSIGRTRKNKYKIFCLISRDGRVHGQLNQLRAISFKDQPRVGYKTMDEAIDYAQGLDPITLDEYIDENKIPSRGVHVHQQEYEGKYIFKVLEHDGDRWYLPNNPQLEFDFVENL